MEGRKDVLDVTRSDAGLFIQATKDKQVAVLSAFGHFALACFTILPEISCLDEAVNV